ncbi:MAG: adenosine deaminase [Gammaproteobacteria bacterium]|nr:adenosine deaminase [Gammaproteobacteria bacterium]
MHLEGALQPELVFKFSERNDKTPPFATIAELRAEYEFTDLADFISLFLKCFNSLETAQDYEDLTNDYSEHALADNVVHAEIFVEAQASNDADQLMAGCLKAAARWQEKGLDLLFIPTFLRHMPLAEALKSFDELEPYHDIIGGIGLASVEVGFPPENFRLLFDRARELGIKGVAHAGEEGPPEYVWGAIDDLGVERVDHGNRSIEDPVLMARLARDQIPLTMCPLSNLRLCVIDELGNHPLKRFLDAGVNVTVNSDDPAYFGGYLNENFEQTIRALNLHPTDVREIVQNAHDAKFPSPSRNG